MTSSSTAPARATGAFTGRDALLLIGVVFALIFGFRHALTAMVRLWDASPMYSYGFAVPVISAYLLWTRRSVFRALSPQPTHALGAVVLLAAAALATAGRAAGIQVIEQLAFLMALTGAVLALLGVSYLRVSAVALAYLLFMIPLWDGFTESLHLPFQTRSAAIGVWVLQEVGIPAHREATTIALPRITLEVARACSGVNYLVAVMALGLPLGYLYLPGIWRRVALLVVAVSVAALSNGLRVALIGVLAHFEVGAPLHGPFHMLHGLFVAGVGYVALFAGLRLLRPATDSAEPAEQPILSAGAGRPVSLAVASALIVGSVLLGANALARTPRPVPLDGALDRMPLRLGAWMREARASTRTPPEVQAWTGADVEVMRSYRRPDGRTAELFVAYFAAQRQSRELVNYRAGELHARAVPVRIESAARMGAFDANLVRGQGASDVLFWYEMQAAPHASRYAVKVRTLWGAVLRGENSGAVVAVLSPSGDPAGEEALREFASLVQGALAPRLSRATGSVSLR